MVKFSRGDSDLGIVIDTIASICSMEHSESDTASSLSDQEEGPTQEENSLESSPVTRIGKDELMLDELANLMNSVDSKYSHVLA